MIMFDPCGDLLKDYGAFCESLRVIEREDVYSAIHTRTVEVPPLPAELMEKIVAANPGSAEGAEKLPGTANNDGKSSRPPSRATTKEKATGGSVSSGGRRKSARASSADLGATRLVEEGGSAPPPSPEMSTFTYVSLHYPVFCLNQRDMTPLSRAIPHCPSLLSIELVGCGLSVQSYMQLVRAVYCSPRVLSFTADFNRRRSASSDGQGTDVYHFGTATTDEKAEAGFVSDPTVHTVAVTESLTDATMLSQEGIPMIPNLSLVSHDRPFVPTVSSIDTADRASPPAVSDVSAGSGRRNSRNGGSGGDSKAVGSPNQQRMQIVPTDAPNTALLGGEPANEEGGGEGEEEEGSDTMYFYPTQYCGLDQQPTALELQLQEEVEKKGKVDGKRLQQVQAQRDALRAFNQKNRMEIPRGWESILFTGVRSISLRGNAIDDAAVQRLVDVLLQNPRSQLESLNLWGNDITDVGAMSLAQLLRRNTDIRVLDIGHNKLSDTGLLEVVETLRMQQVTTAEEVLAARRAYLSRRGATEAERKAVAAAFVLSDIPSYEDLYAHWWYTQQQLLQQQQQQVVSPRKGEKRGGSEARVFACPTFALPTTSYPPPPPPTHHSVSLSPSATANSKRAAPAKGKTAKSESVPGGASGAGSAASAATTLSSSAARAAMRPTNAFDKDCVRVSHVSDSDPSIRVPGNMVLEVLNLEGNQYVTVAGVREAARRLALREPSTTNDMLAMVEVQDAPAILSFSASGTPSAASLGIDGASKRPSFPSHRGASGPAAAAAASTAGVSAAITSLTAAALPTQVPVTVIHPPELHCAGLRLRACALRSHQESDRDTWGEMEEIQHRLDLVLAQGHSTSTSPSMG